MADEGHVLSRRGFLGTVGAGLVTFAASAGTAVERGDPQVQRRPLGRTGVMVPILGAGLDFDTIPGQIVLHQSLRRGITYWDTSPTYMNGNSEVGIGHYLSKFPHERERLFIATKSSRFDPDGLEASLRGSLARLRTDHVDLMMLYESNSPSDLDNAETARWAAAAKASGRIRFFGVSTHNAEPCLAMAARTPWIDVALFRYNYRLVDDPGLSAAIDACYRAGVGLVVMKFRGLGPTGQHAMLRELELFNQRGLDADIAKLKAIWQDRRISTVLATARDVETLKAFAGAASDFNGASEDEMRALRALAEATMSDYCEGCGHRCEPAAGLPVADVMRCLMYRRGYGDPERARAAYRRLPEHVRSRMSTADLSRAERLCPRHLPLARLVREAAAELA